MKGDIVFYIAVTWITIFYKERVDSDAVMPYYSYNYIVNTANWYYDVEKT